MEGRIEGWARDMLARQGVFGTLATLRADGSPHLAVVWYLVRGDTIVINSRVGRVWPTNLLRDPRCSISIEDGYEWVSVRGRVETVTDQQTAQADIAEMARRYHESDPEKAEAIIRNTFRSQERISFLIHPDHIAEHPDT